MSENELHAHDQSRPKVAFPVGDPGGIGPELCLKAALSKDVRELCRPLIFGDLKVLQEHARLCEIPWDVEVYTDLSEVDWTSDKILILARDQFSESDFTIGEIKASHGTSILDSAQAAITAAVSGEVDAVVACPHTQSAIAKSGVQFDGYPSYVAKITNKSAEEVFLMLCVDDIRIAHCTLHVGLRDALDMIDVKRVKSCIQATYDTLKKIGIPQPKILISGINPHASENGLFGDEEANIIIPAVEEARSKGIHVEGPVGADNMLHRQDIDAFIVMFHDQGHIPAKLLARHRTAAVTIGSPILFSSVAHGSALDIAGQGKADISALVQALTTVIPS
ncbi:MAG: 4-hydroxythreonine-4-phosphate dehydrogenase PdxA [Emcibacter sp.]|nr:4-hydroxythreonine-4-phosphate dehydrogenase PdxA [Emcibacter sp.]